MKFFSKLALSSVASKRQSGLGFGCMGITCFYGDSMADEHAMELLKAVYDAGSRHFDTAEIYATKEKHNEEILGQFFKTVPRDSFTVATKYWPKDGKYDYDSVKESLTKSLDRLGLSFLDLYYAHRVTSLEGGLEFGRAAAKLKEEGLIREVGLSEVSPEWLKEIHAEACPIDAVQLEWSLLTRNVEEEFLPILKELDITIVAYSPLARNLLASKLTVPPADWRASFPRYAVENLSKNQEIADIIQELAAKNDATAAQVSLAWLFYKANELGVTVVPIPGSTKMAHALGNVKATSLELAKEDVQVLESLADKVAGARANEEYMKTTFEAHK